MTDPESRPDPRIKPLAAVLRLNREKDATALLAAIDASPDIALVTNEDQKALLQATYDAGHRARIEARSSHSDVSADLAAAQRLLDRIAPVHFSPEPASPPDTEALDVDVMRQAVHNVVCDRPAGWAKHGPGHGIRCQLGGWAWNEAIAAEYARLASREEPTE